MIDYNAVMVELAQYNRMAEDIAGVIEGLKDQLKQYMIENNIDVLSGAEHKAIYKTVCSNRIDTAALKKELPDVAAAYTKQTESLRFTFA